MSLLREREREREREKFSEKIERKIWGRGRLKKRKEKNKESVWYMCLKIENCYLKTFVEIRVGEKVCGNK